ncbi:MAG: TetR/AcrR family transcriptional regulator [Bacteroidales bacterium]|nr:TetR/AcrR family transcriptional regulator [Bacteroidales bacterium]
MAKKPASTTVGIDWLNDTEWIYAPIQDRSRKTLQKILTTAKALFVANGFDETTMTEISRKSGISVGSIYHRFPDKPSILYAILETYRRTRFTEIAELTVDELWRGKKARDVLDFHIEILFSSACRDRGFFRLLERQRIVDRVVRDMLIEWNQHFCSLIVDLYRRHARSLDHSDIDKAVHYMHNIIRGSVMWSILPDQEGEPPLQVTSAEYRAEATRMAALYLGI